jgi:transposase
LHRGRRQVTPLISATAGQRRALRAQLEAHDDATLLQHSELWEREQGMRVSISMMSRAMRRVGWTLKKRRWALPSETKRQGALGGIR